MTLISRIVLLTHALLSQLALPYVQDSVFTCDFAHKYKEMTELLSGTTITDPKAPLGTVDLVKILINKIWRTFLVPMPGCWTINSLNS